MKRLGLAVTVATLAITAPAAAASNLVVNGSFESGAFAPGWLNVFDTTMSLVQQGVVFQSPTNGQFQAFFGPRYTFGAITQVLVSSATSYTVSFDLGNSGGSANYVDFGDTTLLSNIADNGGAWTHYSFIVNADPNPRLTFGFFNPTSLYVLDNVVVTANSAIPEPSAWAMLIAGFGVTGVAMRRRRIALAA